MSNARALIMTRTAIDRMDEQIAQLLHDRAVLSRCAQNLKVADGHARVDLAREHFVRGTYTETLGTAGNRIADAVLNYSKGHLS